MLSNATFDGTGDRAVLGGQPIHVVALRPLPAPWAPSRPPEAVSDRNSEPAVDLLSLSRLRQAIRANRVSFPSQVPIFAKHDRPDLQRKMVQLYFVLGWNCSAIGQRYGLIRQRVQQILNTWKRRAIQMGYIQDIPPEEKLGGAPQASRTTVACV